jgi:hypothetical protein
MNMEKLDILLKQGLNELVFGASPEDAEKLLGDPIEIEALEKDTDEDLDSQLWYYDEEGISLFFEGEHDLELTSIEVSNLNATLFGKAIFKMSEEQIIDLMKENGFNDFYQEDEEWGEKLLSFEDALIDFYFEEDKLIGVNWSASFF